MMGWAMEREIAEEVLRKLATVDGKVGKAAMTLLGQMAEMRRQGGDPICILEENGQAWIFDATHHMGT